MQHWGDGVTLSSHWDSLLTFRWVLYLWYYLDTLPTKSVGSHRKRAICWVTAVSCKLWASVQTCKMHPVSLWLLDHLLQDSRMLWINEYQIHIFSLTRWLQRRSQAEIHIGVSYKAMKAFLTHTHTCIHTHVNTHTQGLEQHVVHPENRARLMVARILLAWWYRLLVSAEDVEKKEFGLLKHWVSCLPQWCDTSIFSLCINCKTHMVNT